MSPKGKISVISCYILLVLIMFSSLQRDGRIWQEHLHQTITYYSRCWVFRQRQERFHQICLPEYLHGHAEHDQSHGSPQNRIRRSCQCSELHISCFIISTSIKLIVKEFIWVEIFQTEGKKCPSQDPTLFVYCLNTRPTELSGQLCWAWFTQTTFSFVISHLILYYFFVYFLIWIFYVICWCFTVFRNPSLRMIQR